MVVSYGERRYRVRGFSKNLSSETLKINLHIAQGEAYYVDTFDLYSARARHLYIVNAAKDLARARGDREGRSRPAAAEARILAAIAHRGRAEGRAGGAGDDRDGARAGARPACAIRSCWIASSPTSTPVAWSASGPTSSSGILAAVSPQARSAARGAWCSPRARPANPR